jgi:ketosteroid isomerase-like protein
MGAAENKRLLENIFAASARGDSRPLVDAMADDFRWTIAGNGRWSRSYEGKQAVLAELFPVLRARIEGRIKMIPQRILGDGDHVVVEARGDNMTKAGQRYDNSYCFVFRLAGGKLAEVTEYMDTELVTSALGAPNG